MKEKINYNKLNDLINLSTNILKILFIFIIIIGVYSSLILLKELQILPVIFTIISVISPVFIGIIIAWLFDPVVTKLNKKGVKRGIGALLCYILFLGIIIFMISSLIPVLSEQINDFVQTTIPTLFEKSKKVIDDIFVGFDDNSIFDIASMEAEIYKKLEVFATDLTTSLPEIIVNLFQSLFSSLGNFGIGLIIGFYLLLDYNKNTENFYYLLPKKYRSNVKELLGKINKPLRAFVNGALVDCTLVFIICAVGFSLIGLKASLLFALFCAITNIIPFIGPYIGGIPAVVVALTQSPGVGIAVLIFIVVVQAIEGNLLQPWIMSKAIKLSPVLIMVGLLVLGHFFGIIGMVIATPLLGSIKEIINYLDEKYDFLSYKNSV